jgi:DNA polymerase
VNRRRAEILAEMGLAPVWRLRRTEATGITPQPGSVAVVEAPSRAQDVQRLGWQDLKARVKGCTDCKLRATCTQTVFGVGDERAQWMFVGEAPGAEEDRLGEPFVGQAGKLLDNMLVAIGLQRGRNAYIGNVIKCRPPGNRNPEPAEVAACTPYLVRQIALIEPKLIVAMGRFAAQTLLQTEATIASLRGTVHRYAGVPLIVTYHPAYLLRNLPDKAKAWADLRFAARTMAGLQ